LKEYSREDHLIFPSKPLARVSEKNAFKSKYSELTWKNQWIDGRLTRGRPDYYFHEEKRTRISESIYPLPPEAQSNIEDSVSRVEEWLGSAVNSPLKLVSDPDLNNATHEKAAREATHNIIVEKTRG
jgi:hypothetical protein